MPTSASRTKNPFWIAIVFPAAFIDLTADGSPKSDLPLGWAVVLYMMTA